MLRPDPARPVLVVGDRDGGAAPEVWEALTGVLATLPDLGATAPYGLLYAPGADTAAARAWAEANGLDWLGPADDGPAPEPDHGPVQAARGLGAPGVRGGAPAPSTDLDQTPACPDASAPGPAAPVPVVTATTPPPPATTAAAAAPAAARRSGPADRAALRELLGDRYHLLASKSELLASRLPSLRSTLQDDLKPDMVAIALYQADTPDPASRADLVAAARAAAPGSLTPLLRCLGSGLRRLPGHYGAVMLAAPAEALPLDRYMPGSLLVEPAPVAAVPACDAELEGSVEFGIWSTTGRRTSVFGGPDDEPEVVFPPGTAFSVLALQPPEDDEGLIRVLLREISHSEAQAAGYGASLVGAPDDRFRERDDQARTRLTAWFERRDMLEPEGRRTLPNATRYHLSPGAAHR
jgi:hypothetical protein